MAVTMCSYINQTYTSLRHVDASSRFRFRVGIHRRILQLRCNPGRENDAVRPNSAMSPLPGSITNYC